MIRFALLLSMIAAPLFAESLPKADIVVLGEVHDNAEAHLGQARMLAELAPKAVVFEMLTPEQAARANADHSAIPLIWGESKWPDFAIYKPIFDALGTARIVGAAVPRDGLGEVYEKGAVAVFGSEAGRFGLDVDLPADQKAARELMQFQAHCEAMPMEMMARMVGIQRFRDAVFARAALEALTTHGAPVVVIAGNGHARTDWGVPAMIAAAEPGVATLSIAFVEGPTDVPYDQVHLVPPAERDDPCDSLREKQG